MENEDPEVIRKQMLENRTALSEKLETLEQQVMGVATAVTDSVENVKEGVQNTIDSVKESVEETVESVKESFNIRRHVEENPWAMLGGSAGVGFLLGMILPGRSAPRHTSDARSFIAAEPAPARHEASSTPSVVSNALLKPLEEGLTQVKSMALSYLISTVRDVVSSVKGQIGEQVKTILDDVAGRLKGEIPPHGEAHQVASHQGNSGSERHDGGYSAPGGAYIPPGSRPAGVPPR